MQTRLSRLVLLAALWMCSCDSWTPETFPPADAGTRTDAGHPRTDAGLDGNYFDTSLPPESLFQRANPDASEIDLTALNKLIADAEQQQSDSLIVAIGDTIITELYFGKGSQVSEAESITKSVTSLAVGLLLDQGKIGSIDEKVSTWFPEWGQGEKAQVTVRELLNMTSGLEDDPNFFNQSDLLAFARAQALTTTPGSAWAYSNEGVMLFAGIIKQAAGMGADTLLGQHLFVPMGITDWRWDPDGAGNVQTPGGLWLRPLDLLRLGRLARENGSWNGQQLVSSAWITQSTSNQTALEPCYGDLWWIVRPGCGDTSNPTATINSPVSGYFADGWGGNYIAVLPASHVIAVRTKTPAADATFDQEWATSFPTFTDDVNALVH